MFMQKIVLLALAASAATTFAQGSPDLRIRADFRTPDADTWPVDESVGHAEFRIVSRYGQIYYGGVIRQDEYKFKVEVDFRDASGFTANWPESIYNTDYDVYINNGYVGFVDMNRAVQGLGELEYDSRHPSPPALPLPAGFPSPVNVGDVVSLYPAAATRPAVGDARPAGDALLSNELVEMFMRGDVNLDDEVDELDFAYLASSYDPFMVTGPHVGPAQGDFTGDNLSTLADYNVMAINWTSNDPIPPAPAPIAQGCDSIDFNADGLFPDDNDLIDFLSVLAGGACSTSATTNCHDIDFNNDGLFPSDDDVVAFLRVLAGGAC